MAMEICYYTKLLRFIIYVNEQLRIFRDRTPRIIVSHLTKNFLSSSRVWVNFPLWFTLDIKALGYLFHTSCATNQYIKQSTSRISLLTSRWSDTQCRQVSLRDQPPHLCSSAMLYPPISPKRIAAHGLGRRCACYRVVRRSPNSCYSSQSPHSGCGTLGQGARSPSRYS